MFCAYCRLPMDHDLPWHEHALSPRESEIALLVARGRSNKQIAYDLDMSAHTVRAHLGSIFKKLRIDNRATLVLYIVQRFLPVQRAEVA